MNGISKIFLAAMLLILASGIANANMMWRDGWDNNDFYKIMGVGSFGFMAGLGASALVIVALLFVFWLWMLVDCIKRDFKKDVEKIVWVIVIIFLQLLGAVIYYFVIKASAKKGIMKK